MKQFDEYLHEFNEVGVVTQLMQAVVYAAGLPRVRPSEIVMVESGELGQVMSLQEDYVEVLMLSGSRLKLGSKVVRTGEYLSIPVGDSVLSAVMNPMGNPILDTKESVEGKFERRQIDIAPPPLEKRENILDPMETGVPVVDLLVPIGKGQRELVIGDRKIGKTEFLKQAMVSHARQGGICVYGGIARRTTDLLEMRRYIIEQKIETRTVMVVSIAADPAGLVYITPYSAMTVAEYFRDKGLDVLLILDDMTIHAKYYRELSLLSRRFPGRSAYPGDIFYTHARLMERAGKFDRGSITALPVAETVMSDIRGYIQTNLMSMTDGHIFFDHELFNQGRRPPINPFLSVTRVGHQTQPPLLRTLSQMVTSFLVHHEKLTKLMHFGEELSGDIKKVMALGEQIIAFFDQSVPVVPLPVAVVFLASIWTGMWEGVETPVMKAQLGQVISTYYRDDQTKKLVDSIISSCQTVPQLTEAIKPLKGLIVGEKAV